MLEDWRQKVIDEARSWTGTRYHHMARVKGAGVDCLTFIMEVYAEVGLIERIDIPYYRPDFMRHREDDLYFEGVLKYGDEISESEVQPADMILYKWGRVHAHGAIVINLPRVIHASPSSHGVIEAFDNTGRLAHPRKFFTLKKNAINL